MVLSDGCACFCGALVYCRRCKVVIEICAAMSVEFSSLFCFERLCVILWSFSSASLRGGTPFLRQNDGFAYPFWRNKCPKRTIRTRDIGPPKSGSVLRECFSSMLNHKMHGVSWMSDDFCYDFPGTPFKKRCSVWKYEKRTRKYCGKYKLYTDY